MISLEEEKDLLLADKKSVAIKIKRYQSAIVSLDRIKNVADTKPSETKLKTSVSIENLENMDTREKNNSGKKQFK